MSQTKPELHPDAEVLGCCEHIACRGPAYYQAEDRLTGMSMKVCHRHLAMMADHSSKRTEMWEKSLDRLKARSALEGEADSTVSTLRGEAGEIRNRVDDAEDVAEQLEHRADEIEAALERLWELSPE